MLRVVILEVMNFASRSWQSMDLAAKVITSSKNELGEMREHLKQGSKNYSTCKGGLFAAYKKFMDMQLTIAQMKLDNDGVHQYFIRLYTYSTNEGLYIEIFYFPAPLTNKVLVLYT